MMHSCGGHLCSIPVSLLQLHTQDLSSHFFSLITAAAYITFHVSILSQSAAAAYITFHMSPPSSVCCSCIHHTSHVTSVVNPLQLHTSHLACHLDCQSAAATPITRDKSLNKSHCCSCQLGAAREEGEEAASGLQPEPDMEQSNGHSAWQVHVCSFVSSLCTVASNNAVVAALLPQSWPCHQN